MSHKTTAVHLVSEGAYIVKAPWIHSGHVEVAGMKTPSGDFVTDSLDGIEVVMRLPGVQTHYADSSGETLTTQRYGEQMAALTARGSYDDDGELTFASLDDEFAYRKFTAQWKAVYGPERVVREPLEIEVVEVRTASGDEDIASMWNSPAMHADRKLYSMNRNSVAVKLLRAGCTAFSIPLEIPTHSGIRYAQLCGEYAFGSTCDYGERSFVGTLEQCRAEKQRIAAQVDRVVQAYAAKLAGVPVSNAGELLTQLRGVAEALSDIRAKSDHAGRLNSVRKEVAEMVRGLEAFVAGTRKTQADELPPIAA